MHVIKARVDYRLEKFSTVIVVLPRGSAAHLVHLLPRPPDPLVTSLGMLTHRVVCERQRLFRRNPACSAS